ncbi:MAG: hypothetical protein QOC69_3427, partial [Mycobacterium sp.]|nr:hypothetical protein [Mycobacterium sp.]
MGFRSSVDRWSPGLSAPRSLSAGMQAVGGL